MLFVVYIITYEWPVNHIVHINEMHKLTPAWKKSDNVSQHIRQRPPLSSCQWKKFMYVLNWQRTFRKHSPERTTCRLQSPWANRGELVWRGRNLLSTIVLFSWMTVVKKFPMLVQTIRHSHRMVALNYNRSFGWDSVITSEINQDAFGWRLRPTVGPRAVANQRIPHYIIYEITALFRSTLLFVTRELSMTSDFRTQPTVHCQSYQQQVCRPIADIYISHFVQRTHTHTRHLLHLDHYWGIALH